MTKHERELEKLLAAIAQQADARLVELRKTNGGHVRASFDRGGSLFMSPTPSDIRSIKNFRAQARRALR
jgi:hypothetical protein